MKQHIPEEFFTKLIDRSPFVIMGNTMPPEILMKMKRRGRRRRGRKTADEPPVVREPNEN